MLSSDMAPQAALCPCTYQGSLGPIPVTTDNRLWVLTGSESCVDISNEDIGHDHQPAVPLVLTHKAGPRVNAQRVPAAEWRVFIRKSATSRSIAQWPC